MIGTLLAVVLILAAGTRATDAVRLRQQEIVLRKLPTAEAAAFYAVLRKRAWKVRALRMLALASVVVIVYARGRAQMRAIHPAPPPLSAPLAPPATAIDPRPSAPLGGAGAPRPPQ